MDVRAKMPIPKPDERRYPGGPRYRRMDSMSAQSISFALQGMFCPKCAGIIERALTQLDGIVAAQVNYATERATVVYDPMRVTASRMVSAIRSIGYDTPLESITVLSDDLLYATSARAMERVLGKIEGVVQVSVRLTERNAMAKVLPGYARRGLLERGLAGLGVNVVESLSEKGPLLLFIRTVILVGMELLALWSAGAHAGLFGDQRALHTPLLVLLISVVTLFGAGLPFYRFAYDAALCGEFDASVVLALVASASATGSLPTGILLPSPWFTDIGFVIATTLTTGWFLGRALALWVLPRFHQATRVAESIAAGQASLGAVSHGSRH